MVVVYGVVVRCLLVLGVDLGGGVVGGVGCGCGCCVFLFLVVDGCCVLL